MVSTVTLSLALAVDIHGECLFMACFFDCDSAAVYQLNSRGG